MAGAGSFTLMGLKEDGMESAKVGAAALAGAVLAKQVVKYAAAFGTSTTDLTKKALLPPAAVALIPLVAGIAIHSKGKMMYPLAAPGIAAGMVAFGLANLVTAFAPVPATGPDMIRPYLPFNGVDSYDSRMLAGAPVDIQRLGYGGGYNQFGVRSYMQGAPTSVQQLNGLGSAPMSAQVLSTHGGMSASLQ